MKIFLKKTLKILREEYMLTNKKTIKKIMEIPFTKKELDSQHRYIKFLIDNEVKAPNILKSYTDNNRLIEEQEYIDGNNKVNTSDLIKAIAKFHKASKKYSKRVYKKNIYNCSFSIRNINLDKVLLGYEEKFQIYPMINYYQNKHLIRFFKKSKINYITKKYNYMYNCIYNKFNNNRCLIHNDITLNNIINHNDVIYLIDFDFCIYGFEVVDIADAILTKYSNIKDITNNIKKFKKDIDKYCAIYNNINNIKISSRDIMYQIVIKIISFNYYILLNNQNKNSFNSNIKIIYKLVKAVQI